MQATGNTILITGGATGIGFELAKAFIEAGNRVLICGRRTGKLDAAKAALPQVITHVCDVADPAQREELCEWATATFPELNILVNNAGIQKQHDFANPDCAPLLDESEIIINFEAPVHLAGLFLSHLMARENAAFVNVTSGLAFTPLAIMPVYCATKAALHSFSMSLRHQLRDTSVRVFEVIPPKVDTELDRGARQLRGETERGISADVVARVTLEGMAADQPEIVVPPAEGLRAQGEKMFGVLNR